MRTLLYDRSLYDQKIPPTSIQRVKELITLLYASIYLKISKTRQRYMYTSVSDCIKKLASKNARMCKVIFGLLRRHQRFFQVTNRSRLVSFHLCLRRSVRVIDLVTFRDLVVSDIMTQHNLFQEDWRRSNGGKFLKLQYFHSLMLMR